MIQQGAHNTATPATQRDAPAVDDFTCIFCEYILRGLQRDGVCPECGGPVSASIDPERFVRVDARALRRIRNGTAGLVLAPGIVLLFALIRGAVPSIALDAVLAVAAAVWVALSAVLLSVPPRPLQPPRAMELRRRVLRFMSPLAVLAALAAIALPLDLSPGSLLAVALAICTGVSSFWALASYSGWLAARIDLHSVAAHFDGTHDGIVFMLLGAAASLVIVLARVTLLVESSDAMGSLLIITISIMAFLLLGGLLGCLLVVPVAWFAMARIWIRLNRLVKLSRALHAGGS
ncbi:MAG: hypothetical protein IT430_02160 [Phycisphaerales bacterium]|nr:hypothetical protein [Phycisphaerales bacterium]